MNSPLPEAKKAQYGTVMNTGSAKTCIVYSPSGSGINLIQHIRKDSRHNRKRDMRCLADVLRTNTEPNMKG